MFISKMISILQSVQFWQDTFIFVHLPLWPILFCMHVFPYYKFRSLSFSFRSFPNLTIMCSIVGLSDASPCECTPLINLPFWSFAFTFMTFLCGQYCSTCMFFLTGIPLFVISFLFVPSSSSHISLQHRQLWAELLTYLSLPLSFRNLDHCLGGLNRLGQ